METIAGLKLAGIGVGAVCVLLSYWWVYKQGRKACKEKEWAKARAFYEDKMGKIYKDLTGLDANPNALWVLYKEDKT